MMSLNCPLRDPAQRARSYPQHAVRCWIGGHGMLPYEQNTQQSPGLGRSNTPQCGHSWKNRHASVGMTSVD